MRKWLALSGLLAGLTLGMTAPGLVACSCGANPPVAGIYTITEAPTLPAAVGGTVEVTDGAHPSEDNLIVRYEQDGHEVVIVYDLID